ncbi:hypothetical protein HELRODRAFT_178224 [Helobdella robusta]|uniref:Uncharacterized protein n=1 Tax=Helobdella robusta TaxID=6412 RepID=T1FCY5_HELRO|nr:hypothetical protein HELRODRAFT_178224 [Helobdella robusta]ESN97429.1 hypothetical protein HELRODRAFT_178224 [Helobdella robusta]
MVFTPKPRFQEAFKKSSTAKLVLLRFFQEGRYTKKPITENVDEVLLKNNVKIVQDNKYFPYLIMPSYSDTNVIARGLVNVEFTVEQVSKSQLALICSATGEPPI